MLINADYKQLEWQCAALLSEDETAIHEIRNGTDLHEDNRASLGLPSRLIAKKFLFRLIYGGSSFSYANDADFATISTHPDYWQGSIAAFYRKYKGLHRWHRDLLRSVIETNGRYESPSGRQYLFSTVKTSQGYTKWPRTTILNYPVQGLGADIMMLARLSLGRRLTGLSKVQLLATVHDSILIDTESTSVDQIVKILFDVWRDLPQNYERCFKPASFHGMPCRVEVKVGPNWKEMKEIREDV